MARKVLILAASPIDTVRLQGYAEVRQILDVHKRSNHREDFDVQLIPAIRSQDFQQALLDHRPEVVHFVGHGVENAGLVLEMDDGAAQLVTGDRLREWFAVAKSVKCVILNACYSEVQATEIARVVPCVIGTLYSFCDRAALEFSIGFYGALFARESYRDSFRMGKSGITDLMEANGLIPMIRDEVENLSAIELEQPGSRMPIESKFYVMRSPAEEDAVREVVKPGALIRIKAPREFGKSSLMGRVIDHAERQGAKTVAINFREIDQEFLGSLKEFLTWFCNTVQEELNVTDGLDDRKGKALGYKRACGDYFERSLLSQMQGALVLELDELDFLMDKGRMKNTDLVDFLSMLRAWHEKGTTHKQWRKLRLVLVHSKHVDPKEFPQSPFDNVGLEIPLAEFSPAQVVDLSQRHGLSAETGRKLTELVGGHPHLVRMGLYAIAGKRLTLEEIWKDGATDEGLYGQHLMQHRSYLEQHSDLMTAFREVLAQSEGVKLKNMHDSVALRSLGLVKPLQNEVRITCKLYRQYFDEVWV